MESLNKKLKEELVEGKEYAKQLQEILHKPFGDDGWVFTQELVEKIVKSFTDSLIVANSLNGMCQIGAPGGGASDGRSSQVSGERRRGCYKRRRAAELGVKVTATMEDGYAWRKYGRKEILNSKYPRCYFRCTHKYDQGCQATKQVQRVDHVEEDRPKYYKTTYFGKHICKDTTRPPQIILQEDYSDTINHPVIIIDHQVATTAVPEEITQQECKKRTTQSRSDDLTDNKSSTGSTMWQDLIGPGSASMGSAYNPATDDVASSSSLYSSGSTSLYGLDMKTLSCFTDFSFDFEDDNNA